MNDFERAAQALERAGRTQRPSWPHDIKTYQGNRETPVERVVGLILGTLIVFTLLLAVVVIGH